MVHFRMRIASLVLITAMISSSIQLTPAPVDRNSTQNITIGYARLVKSIRETLMPEQNVLFSPNNIFITLLLLHMGSSGETRTELSTFLEISDPEYRRKTWLYEVMSNVMTAVQNTSTAQVKISNSLFAQQGTLLKEDYLHDMRKYFLNEVHQVDFAKGGSDATDIINRWVSRKTKKRITQAYKNQLPTTTQLIATSAVFFNATWKLPFDKQNTKNELFDTGTRQIQVPMMNHKAYILRGYTRNYEIIGIPFAHEEYTLFVYLPTKNTLFDIFSPKDHEHDAKLLMELNIIDYVDYKLPRFRLGGLYSYKNHTIKSGVKRLFKNGAELDHMLETAEHLHVSDVNYVVDLQMDENGISTPRLGAARKSSGQASRPSLKPEPQPSESFTFYADRPFSFSIYHVTNEFLFYGTIQNPLSVT